MNEGSEILESLLKFEETKQVILFGDQYIVLMKKPSRNCPTGFILLLNWIWLVLNLKLSWN